MAIKLKAQEGQGVHLGVEDVGVRFGLGDHIEVVQSTDYNDLENKPQINGVTLEGNKTTEDLGIQAGVTSWNGQTGDVTYTPPVQSVNGQTGEVVLTIPTKTSELQNDSGYLTTETDPTVPSWAKEANPPSYELTYDESVSVGSAEVGEAVTGEPNYTPSGTVEVSGTVRNNATKENITVMYGGNATLNASYSNYVLTLSTSFSPSTYIKGVVTNVGNPTFNGTGNFTGNGVKFAVEQEN